MATNNRSELLLDSTARAQKIEHIVAFLAQLEGMDKQDLGLSALAQKFESKTFAAATSVEDYNTRIDKKLGKAQRVRQQQQRQDQQQQQQQQLEVDPANFRVLPRAAVGPRGAFDSGNMVVEDEAGFDLYDGADGHEREAVQPPMELSDDVLALLASFDVDPVRGFLPATDPLRRLPQPQYQPWEAMADALPKLLAAGQARKPLERVPVISIDGLACYRERMRALLLLSTFAHASVWGNPDKPQDTIPRGVAVPLCALAAAEGMPPLMTHASLVLHNWHRLDPNGPVRARNLACNCRFLGGQDETWFYTITVEIEARGGGVFGALLEAQHAIKNISKSKNPSGSDRSAAARVVVAALAVAQKGIKDMQGALSRMPEGCHPLIFYQRVRPFLSGWKANPTLPNGVLYEGVSSERMKYYGGSAAQSTLFPALDAALGVSHAKHSSNAFLLEMRGYMPPGHRRLLEHLADPACPSIRRFIENFPEENTTATNVPGNGDTPKNHLKNEPGNGFMSNGSTPQNEGQDTCAPNFAAKIGGSCASAEGHSGSSEEGTRKAGGGDTGSVRSEGGALREAYNSCLKALQDFRSTHLGIVSSYIMQHQKREKKIAEQPNSRGDFAGGKGTGGTPLLDFLRPLKEDARSCLFK